MYSLYLVISMQRQTGRKELQSFEPLVEWSFTFSRLDTDDDRDQVL